MDFFAYKILWYQLYFFSFGTATETNGCIYLTSTDLCKNSVPGMEPEKSFAEYAKFDIHYDIEAYCKGLVYEYVSCHPWV